MNLSRVEEKLIIVSEDIGVAAYDFNFDLHFACTHPYRIESEELCVLRVGAIADYATEFRAKLELGLRLINSPAQHAMASELENWYPFITDLTPRTEVFEALPEPDEIESTFQWPIFMKGSRQTSKHNPDLSIITSREHYLVAAALYRCDPILHWQKPVIREFVPLAPVPGQVGGKVRPSVEYRSFWWFGKCVGWGRYWYQIAPYACADTLDGLAVAAMAASRLDVPFIVIDFAKTAEGRWIVIECNDAQESGYAAIPPHLLWREIFAKVASR